MSELTILTEAVEAQLLRLQAGEWQEAAQALEELLPRIVALDEGAPDQIERLRVLLLACLAEAERHRGEAAEAFQRQVKLRATLRDAAPAGPDSDGGHFVDQRL